MTQLWKTTVDSLGLKKNKQSKFSQIRARLEYTRLSPKQISIQLERSRVPLGANFTIPPANTEIFLFHFYNFFSAISGVHFRFKNRKNLTYLT